MDDGEYRSRALEAAAEAQREAGTDGLTARMHVPRGGQLASNGEDPHAPDALRHGIDSAVRERACFLWQREECPDGRATEHWHRTLALAEDHADKWMSPMSQPT